MISDIGEYVWICLLNEHDEFCKQTISPSKIRPSIIIRVILIETLMHKIGASSSIDQCSETLADLLSSKTSQPLHDNSNRPDHILSSMYSTYSSSSTALEVVLVILGIQYSFASS